MDGKRIAMTDDDKTDDYKTYEQKCKSIKKENAGYLAEFRDSLEAFGLSDKTIERHIGNVDFFLNSFMFYEDACPMTEGPSSIGYFLGYFFIHKCTWASPSSIKSNATSLKKFYKLMLAKKRISDDDYTEMTNRIKDEVDDWIGEYEKFMNGTEDDLDGLDDPDDVEDAEDLDW